MRFLVLYALAASAGLSVFACGSDGDARVAPSGTVATAPAPDGGSNADPETGAVDAQASCTPTLPPACTSAPPFVGPQRDWRHGTPGLGIGSPNHRGRDLFLNPGVPQWIIGKFAYGKALAEVTAKDEEVDVWLNRDCGAGWEKIGTTTTSDAATRPTIEGVEDGPGRVYFPIPENKALGLGRHRVRLVMAGDLSWTEVFIEVVSPGTPLFVSDVDGTLTTSESVEFTSLLTSQLSPANDGAPEALTALASRGYRPMYLTARPEWLVERTRDFVRDRGFPAGIIHTTTSGALPANGAAAVEFKSGELAMLNGKGLTPAFVFGNTDTDATAYDNGQIQPKDHRLFFQFGDPAGGQIFGGRRFESYKTLVSEFQGLPTVCP